MKCIDCNAKIIWVGPSPSDYQHEKGNCFYYFRFRIEELERTIADLLKELQIK